MFSGVRSFNSTLYDRTSLQLNPTPPVPIKSIYLSSYRLQEFDFGYKLLFFSADPITIYIGKNIVDPRNIGKVIICKQVGAGQITFTADSGVILNSTDSEVKTRVQYSTVAIIVEPRTSDVVISLEGDLTA